MDKKWNVVDILSYARHDWLNQLQLIKGNIALNRLDRVNEIIEEIIREAEHESRLTHTKLSSFAGYVMTYNWRSSPLQLEIEILGEAVNLSAYDQVLLQWFTHFTELIEKNVDVRFVHHLSISLLNEGQTVRFFFDFSGILMDIEPIRLWLDKDDQPKEFKIAEKHLEKEELSIVLELT